MGVCVLLFDQFDDQLKYFHTRLGNLVAMCGRGVQLLSLTDFTRHFGNVDPKIL